MKELKNNLYRHLEIEESIAILETAKALEKIFKKKVFGIHVNANINDKNELYGLSFSFDMNEHEREKAETDPKVMA